MLDTWIAKLHALLNHRRVERDFASEVETHLALLTSDLVRRGMSPAAARHEAHRQFGGVTQIRDTHREARGFAHLERLLADLLFASRMMRRNPGFTAIAMATLALGIGVNTAIFSAYNAVALKPLPVADPHRVVRLERWFESGSKGDLQYAFSYPEYRYLQQHTSGFSGLVATGWPFNADAEGRGGALAGKLQGQLVSANYFAIMGVSARTGRTFLPDEDAVPGANAVVVLSHAAWLRNYRGEPGAVGQTVKLNGRAFTIIGVAPPEFTGTAVVPSVPDFWTPISMQAQLVPASNSLDSVDNLQFQLLARLRPGIAASGAQAEGDILLHQFGATHQPRDKTVALTLQRTAFFGNVDDPRFQVFVAGIMLVVGLVLLVACANLANLLLARAAARQREISVRLALGASRGRVIRQLLTESIALALAGGAAGLLMATWFTRLLWLAVQDAVAGPFAGNLHLAIDLTPDLRVYAYTLLLSLVTGILFGLSPALRATRSGLMAAIKESGGTGAGRSRMRAWLLGTQVAVSMLLLITAGLLTRGLLRSREADPGFDTHSLYLLSADFGDDPAKAAARQLSLVERLRTLPQIAGVSIGDAPLLGTWTPPIVAGNSRSRTLASHAGQDYLETVGIPLLRGRRPSGAELRTGAPVALVSEATGRLFWPASDPLGRRFQLDMTFRGDLRDFEVIGVVRDVRFGSLTRLDLSHVYLPNKPAEPQLLLLRTRGEAQPALAAVRSAVQSADPDLGPNLTLVGMDAGPLWFQRMQVQAGALFAASLAALALLLAGVGIYGVMVYLVGRRTREIGIRMALGASGAEVVRSVVVSGLRPVFTGMLVGVAAAGGVFALLNSTLSVPGSADLLYGVPFYDPVTFAGISVFVLLVTSLASFVPARRAVRVDPVVALRYE